MKKSVVAALLALAHLTAFACEPIGWRLVSQKAISATERLCTYEKNRVQLAIMVNGLCPLSPC